MVSDTFFDRPRLLGIRRARARARRRRGAAGRRRRSRTTTPPAAMTHRASTGDAGPAGARLRSVARARRNANEHLRISDELVGEEGDAVAESPAVGETQGFLVGRLAEEAASCPDHDWE